MREIHELHREAMTIAEQSTLARIEGEAERARTLVGQAYEKEREAAMRLVLDYRTEPTRSVLFRSAAALAFEASLLNEAAQLCHLGLSGNPPEETTQEIRDILDRAEFARYLNERGIELTAEELEVSISGDAIGERGIAPSRIVFSRLETLQALVLRTAERVSDRPYRRAGPRPKDVAEGVDMFVQPPTAGSFAVAVRLGRQSNVPGASGLPERVVDEIFDCLESYESGSTKSLRGRFREESYYVNFVTLANAIAPDGVEVRSVNFTAQRGGRRRRVSLGRRGRGANVRLATQAPSSSAQRVEVTGTLKQADARGSAEIVGVEDRKGKMHQVRVPEGWDDIVKPYWLSDVVVKGYSVRVGARRRIELESIRSADSSESE